MAKIVLDTILSNNDQIKINNNFQKIAQELNNKVLYRNNPIGEPNSLEGDVDVNNQRLINASEVRTAKVIVAGVDINQDTVDSVKAAQSAAEALQYRNEAANSALNALNSAVASEGSAMDSAQEALNSANSASDALGYAVAANASSVSASNSAIAADASADAAALSESNAAASAVVAQNSSMPFRNELINASFVINQRGYVNATNTTIANQFTRDRWFIPTSGQSVTFSASGNKFSATAPASGLAQCIEGVNIKGGSYVLNWIGTGTATVNGVARTKGEVFTLPANTNVLVKFVGVVEEPQLEFGTVPTAFEEREEGDIRRQCYKYYEPVSIGATGIAAASDTAAMSYAFAVPKRAAGGTIQQARTTGINMRIQGSTTAVSGTFSASSSGVTGITFQFVRTGGTFVSGNFIDLNDAVPIFFVSSEITS